MARVTLMLTITSLLCMVASIIVLIIGIIGFVQPELLYAPSRLLAPSLGHIFSELQILTTVDVAQTMVTISCMLMAPGIIALVLSIVGCCGVYREHNAPLTLFSIASIVAIIIEIALIVFGYMHVDMIETKLQTGLDIAMGRSYTTGLRFDNGSDAITGNEKEQAFDFVHIKLQCCGIHDPSDWEDIDAWDKEYQIYDRIITAKVPMSCCKMTKMGQAKNNFQDLAQDDFTDVEKCLSNVASDVTHTDGCHKHIWKILSMTQFAVIFSVVTIMIFQGLSILAACWMRVVPPVVENKIKPV